MIISNTWRGCQSCLKFTLTYSLFLGLHSNYLQILLVFVFQFFLHSISKRKFGSLPRKEIQFVHIDINVREVCVSVCVEEEGYNYTSFGVQREPPTLVKHRQIVLAFNFMPEINIITIIVLYMRWLHTFPHRHPFPSPELLILFKTQFS